RTEAGDFDWNRLREKSEMPEIKAFELKLAQGAKQRGGHVEGEKVTKEIAEIRNITEGETINSPNRFREFDDAYGLLRFVQKIREVGERRVGAKINIGGETQIEYCIKVLRMIGMVI